MQRKRTSSWGRGAAAALAAGAALALAACGSDDRDTERAAGQKGEIVIGATGPLSGPASALGVLYDGMRGKFAEINAAGGIDGNRIRFEVRDDQLNPASTPGVTRQMVEGDDILMSCGSGGSPTQVAVQPYMKARDVAVVPAAGSSELSAENSYLPVPTYEPLAASLVRYAVQEQGKRRVAIAYSDDAVGKPTRAGAKWALQQLGMEPVAEVRYSSTATDQSALAARLRSSNADFVVLNNPASVVGPIIRSAERVGLRPEWGLLWPAQATALPDLVGEQAARRIVFASPFLLGADDEAKGFRDAVKEVDARADTDDTLTMLGWVTATACVKLLERAVASADGGLPSREQVVAAMPGLTYSDAYAKDVRWSEDERSPTGQGLIAGIDEDGGFTVRSDFAPLPPAPVEAGED